jgi:hypothetical protein
MQVLKYIKGICKFEISFLAFEKRLRIEEYVDSDYAGDYIDYRLTYRSVFIFLGGLLTWYFRK